MLLLKHRNHLSRHLHGVQILHPLHGGGEGEAVHIGRKSENSYFNSLTFNDYPFFDNFLQLGTAGEFVVGAYDGEFGLFQLCRKAVQTVVELVVAEGGGIVAHNVHHLYLHIAAEEVEIGGALREIARIEQKHRTFALFAHLVYGLLATQNPAQGVFRRDVRLNLAVGVVGVEYGYCFRAFAGDEKRHGKDCYCYR